MARNIGGYGDEQMGGSSNGGGRIWVKSLPKGDTRVRILQPTNRWFKWQEHFIEGPGAFACDGTKDCPGCTSTNEREQRHPVRWGFNCITQDGRLAVYKCGVKMREKLQRREQNYGGTLLDRDMILQRLGDGLETEYDCDPGEKYPVDFPAKVYDVRSLIMQDFYSALDEFGIAYDVSELTEFDDIWMDFDQEWTEPVLPPGSAKGMPVTRAATKDAPAVASENGERVDSQPSTWTTKELTTYLQANDIEFGAKAPRQRLVTLANAHLAENPPY